MVIYHDLEDHALDSWLIICFSNNNNSDNDKDNDKDGCTPGAKLRYARDAADERARCLQHEYSHWKRCRQAMFTKKCHVIQ